MKERNTESSCFINDSCIHKKDPIRSVSIGEGTIPREFRQRIGKRNGTLSQNYRLFSEE